MKLRRRRHESTPYHEAGHAVAAPVLRLKIGRRGVTVPDIHHGQKLRRGIPEHQPACDSRPRAFWNLLRRFKLFAWQLTTHCNQCP